MFLDQLFLRKKESLFVGYVMVRLNPEKREKITIGSNGGFMR